MVIKGLDDDENGDILQQNNDDYIINFNVGGLYFSTTKDTLLLNNVDENTYFTGLFSKHKFRDEVDKNGAHFIDRDGKRFRHVLNFLRNGTIYVESLQEVSELLEESKYYGLNSMTNKLNILKEEIQKVSEQQSKYICELCSENVNTENIFADKTKRKKRRSNEIRWEFTLDEDF